MAPVPVELHKGEIAKVRVLPVKPVSPEYLSVSKG